MSVSSSINDWNIIDSDSQSKSDKLDIIIEYLKKNNLDKSHLRKLETLTKKINNCEMNQLLILEKLEHIEKHLNISNNQEFQNTQNIHRISNNIWRTSHKNNDVGLQYLTTPNLSLNYLNPLNYVNPVNSVNCEKCEKCNKIKK